MTGFSTTASRPFRTGATTCACIRRRIHPARSLFLMSFLLVFFVCLQALGTRPMRSPRRRRPSSSSSSPSEQAKAHNPPGSVAQTGHLRKRTTVIGLHGRTTGVDSASGAASSSAAFRFFFFSVVVASGAGSAAASSSSTALRWSACPTRMRAFRKNGQSERGPCFPASNMHTQNAPTFLPGVVVAEAAGAAAAAGAAGASDPFGLSRVHPTHASTLSASPAVPLHVVFSQ